MSTRCLLASCLLLSLSACETSPPASVDVALSCPPVPADIVAESKRQPRVEGETGIEISGKLINQVHVKNRALRRAIASHEECRK